MQSSGTILVTLLLCGLMGMLGQGVRAAIGLKTSMGSGTANQQAAFNAAYFALSMMIGFIAGIVAGIGIGLKDLLTVDPGNLKILLGIAAAGYAGADFIENSLSIVLPNAGQPAAAGGGGTDKPAAVVQPHAMLSAPVPVAPTVPQFSAALHSVAPAVNLDTWVPALTGAFAQFGLTSNRRIAAAFGQFLVEARDDFKEVIENLNYTYADRLVQIFPSKFPNVQAAAPYLNNPEKLGNFVYANKLGNGDEASGDGYRFRGRGLIQLTGRNEYSEFGATISMTAEQAAAYCESPLGAAVSGAWYLSSRHCLPYADAWNLAMITRLVNGKAMVDHARRVAFSEAMLKALAS